MDSFVSIIIPTAKRNDLLQECIASIINQTFRNYEAHVIYDGHQETIRVDDKRFNIHVLQENKGKATAVNYGIKLAKGKFVWIFDDDDVALPYKLETDLKTIELTGSDFVYSKAAITEKDVSQEFDVTGYEVPSHLLTYTLLTSFGCFFHMGTVLAKAHCFTKISFNEKLFVAQDLLYLLELSFLFNGSFNNKVTMYWRMHGENSIITKSELRRKCNYLLLQEFWAKVDPVEVIKKSFPTPPQKYKARYPAKAALLPPSFFEEPLSAIHLRALTLKATSYLLREVVEESVELLHNILQQNKS